MSAAPPSARPAVVTAASADFLPMIQTSLPRGGCWPRSALATQAKFLNAVADVAAAVHAQAALLSETESFPGLATWLLADYEADYGLPDQCTPQGQTVAERRAALLAKITALGGQSIAYLEGVAATLGYTMTVAEHKPALAGQARAGDPANTRGAYFWWSATVIGAASAPGLECRLFQLCDAEVQLDFAYIAAGATLTTESGDAVLTDESGDVLITG